MGSPASALDEFGEGSMAGAAEVNRAKSPQSNRPRTRHAIVVGTLHHGFERETEEDASASWNLQIARMR